jgi:hypothetical protein
VLTVSLHIIYIVETIYRACGETVSKECHHSRHQIVYVQQVPVEEEWQKYEYVLQPLVWAKNFNE